MRGLNNDELDHVYGGGGCSHGSPKHGSNAGTKKGSNKGSHAGTNKGSNKGSHAGTNKGSNKGSKHASGFCH